MENEKTYFDCEFNHNKKIDLATMTPSDFKCITHIYEHIGRQIAELDRLYKVMVNFDLVPDGDQIDIEEFKIGRLADNIRCMLEMVIDIMDD